MSQAEENTPDPNAAVAAAKALKKAQKQEEASSLWRDARRRFFRNKLAVAGLVVVTIIVLIAIFADVIQRYDPTKSLYVRGPNAPSLSNQNYQPPSAEHWFGTDKSDRDLWSRMVHGARISLLVGVVVQVIVLLVGVPLGLLAGYLGGWLDTVIMRITDIFYGFPSLLLALLLLSAFGGQIFWVFIAIAVGTWPTMARLVRGQVLSLREKEFVEAARALGVKKGRIMFRHIFPNTLGPLIVAVSFGVPEAILTESFLGYIGVSVPPPATSWGQLVNDGFQAFQSNPPTILLFPALAIAITVMSLNFIGDGLRDALDPKTKNR